jgi:hypothetical protein
MGGKGDREREGEREREKRGKASRQTMTDRVLQAD